MFKKLEVTIVAACFGLAAVSLQAAPLKTFSNGSVADANDVNANFSELVARINSISSTVGAQGPQGPSGANGKGVVTYSWAGYGSSAWATKVFVVTDSAGKLDKEVHSFVRSPVNTATGTMELTRVRSLAGSPVRQHVLKYRYDTNGKLELTGRDSYSADGTTLLSSTNVAANSSNPAVVPGINLRNSSMTLGMNWGTAAMVTVTFNDGVTPQAVSFVVDSRSLLAVENITVKGVGYNACHKILTDRSSEAMGGDFQQISWFCPNNVGLVKSVLIKSGLSSRMMEFDPAQSTAASN
ncbi:hypothetical protein MNBD_GAMMA09-1300 [hydrothermal vent metagenome]|uniref:Uncharacterized protein n=1 Tax=hydrothermal vent metagenome TaxID=652676 RepID=A0A3B0X765_9ZZZZ